MSKFESKIIRKMEVLHDSLAIQTDLARHLVRNGGKKLHSFYLLDGGGGGRGGESSHRSPCSPSGK